VELLEFGIIKIKFLSLDFFYFLFMEIKKKNIKSFFFENVGIKQTIFKNTFWLILSELFTKGITFVIFIWLARHFGPKIYGQWAFALNFVSLFAILVDFGFSALTIRELAINKSKSSQYIDNILTMKLILGLIVLGLIAFIIQFLGKEPEVIRLVYFLAFYIVINNFVTFFQSIFRANEKMQYETICRAIQGLSLLALSAFFIINNNPILTISYAYIGAALIGVLFSLIFIWRYFSKFFLKINWKICKKILKKSWPFLFSGIFYMIYFRIDSVMLGMFSNMKEVGYYNAAYNLFIAIFIIPEIITMSFFPKLSYFYERDKLKFRKIFSNFKLIIVIISLPLTVLLFLLSDFVIIKIYSQEYSASINLLKILSIIILFGFLARIYSWFLTSADEQKQVAKVQGLAALLNIILNYFLIIKYQAIGAAIATLITGLALLVFYYLFFRIKWKIIYEKE